MGQSVTQGKDEDVINQWKDKYNLQSREGNWWKGTALVVTKPAEIAKELLQRYHDAPTAGHPGITKTVRQLVQDYWWPELRKFVQEYVKGCGICQQNTNGRHQQRHHRNDQVVPMDVDPPVFTQVNRAYTEDDKKQHRTYGKCFFCSR